MSRFPEMENEWRGKSVKFLGASESQVSWGSNDDPNEVLTVGETYDVESADVHSWHTKLHLVGFEGIFNSASFEQIDA